MRNVVLIQQSVLAGDPTAFSTSRHTHIAQAVLAHPDKQTRIATCREQRHRDLSFYSVSVNDARSATKWLLSTWHCLRHCLSSSGCELSTGKPVWSRIRRAGACAQAPGLPARRRAGARGLHSRSALLRGSGARQTHCRPSMSMQNYLQTLTADSALSTCKLNR